MKLVADANVLISAVLGGRAALVLNHPDVDQVMTTEFTLAEVQEYVLLLGRRKGITEEILQLGLAALPITIVAPDIYRSEIKQARQLMEKRDPDDVELLALVLHTGEPLWSNDSDFAKCGIPWFTTAEILRRLGILGK